MFRNREALLQAYTDGGYEQVEGWGVDRDLIELFTQIDRYQASKGIKGTLCEIGVHHGRVLALLALLGRDGERAFGVDLFESSQAQNLDHSGSGVRKATEANLAKHAPGTKVSLITENSFLLPTNAAYSSMTNCRLFHIDGGHFLEVVMNDLNIAQTLLSIGGVIVIDDYLHAGFPEVQEGVMHYFQRSTNIKAVPFAIGRNKLFLIEKSHHAPIREFFLTLLHPSRTKRVRVLGYDSICVDPHL